MSEDSRRALLEKYLRQGVERGLSHKLACMVIQENQHFEFYTGDSDALTEFDLSSLTKILCTTLVVAQAIAEGVLNLEEEPWPCWPGVSIEHILTHQAGLPPWIDITSLEDVYKIKPIAKPGEKTLYSDMGFIALGALLEQRFGEPLNELFHTPEVHFKGPEPVDDRRCRVLGGIAGHAGLFGTLRGVTEEALFFLKSVQSPQSKLEEVLKTFAEYPGPRALGFDRPNHSGSTGGAISEQSFGHLGYTGTSLWIDPVHSSIYVLLLRRVDDGSKTREIMDFRRGFHQQAAKLYS